MNDEEAKLLAQTLYDNAVTLVANQHLPLNLKQGIQFTILGGEAPVLQKALTPFITSNGPHVVCVMKWDDSTKQQVRDLKPDVLMVMTSPYGLIDLPQPPTLLIGYENNPMAQESVRKVLVGEMQATGQLPVKISMK
ncbi:MAG: hypothetical protein ACRDF4_02545 [Rhabdochlamydiaceae bacterium]